LLLSLLRVFFFFFFFTKIVCLMSAPPPPQTTSRFVTLQGQLNARRQREIETFIARNFPRVQKLVSLFVATTHDDDGQWRVVGGVSG